MDNDVEFGATCGGIDASASSLLRDISALIPLLREGAIEADRTNSFPARSVSVLQENGVFAAAVPLAHGGSGVADDGRLDRLAALVLEVARGCTTTAQLLWVHSAGVLTISVLASKDQQDRYFSSVVHEGATFTGWGSEPSKWVGLPGVSVELSTELTPTDGGFLLNGEKYFATGAGSFTHYLVWATRSDVEHGSDQSKTVVACVPRGTAGVVIAHDWDAMGQRGTRSDRVSFQDCFVPDNMVFGRNAPWHPLAGGIIGQICLAATYIGSAYASLEFARTYLRTRARPMPPYGSAIEDPVTVWHVGQLVARLAAARALVSRAGYLTARLGHEGALSLVLAAVNAAKAVATEVALDAVNRVFQVCGPSLTRRSNYVPELMLRNVRTLTLHDPVDRRFGSLGADYLASHFDETLGYDDETLGYVQGTP